VKPLRVTRELKPKNQIVPSLSRKQARRINGANEPAPIRWRGGSSRRPAAIRLAGKMAPLNPPPVPAWLQGGTQTREEGGTRRRGEVEARRPEQYAGFSRGDDETARVLRECDRGCTVGGEPPSLRSPTGSDRGARGGEQRIALRAK
jgi:hypothetical protein